MSKRNPKTLGVWGPYGTRVVASETMWKQPLKWNKAAAAAGERHRVFCASLADVFENWDGRLHTANDRALWKDRQSGCWEEDEGEKDFAYHHAPVTLDDVRNRLFRLIDATPNLDWLLLTKRPENIAKMMPEWQTDPTGLTRLNWPRPNVWLGTSVEDQQRADERIPHLLRVPAVVRFLSCEPLLSQVILHKSFASCECGHGHGFTACPNTGGVADTCHRCDCVKLRPKIHWVIVGGESGHGARPMHPDWVRSLRDQCQAAGTAFFFKQWGEWWPLTRTDGIQETPFGPFDVTTGFGFNRVGKKEAGRKLDGREWNEYPIETIGGLP